MSKDIQLSHRCPHLTVEERVILGTDRRSLATRQPIASGASVQVLANNDFFIPSFGLYSQAQLFNAASGPYRIIANENDFQIRSNTETINLTLPLGSRVETDTLVRLINTASENIFAENSRGFLILTETNSMGRDSLLKVSGRSLAALGFDKQIQERGRQVYPGWELVRRPDPTLKDNRFVRFKSPVKLNPVFKVTYRAPQGRCLRCGGASVENDYRFDSQGDVLVVRNENLLHQVALKILLTTKGSNPYHTWYGTTLKSRVGTKAVGIIASLLEEDVSRALEIAQRLQLEQARYQAVSFRERIANILSVRAYPLEADPTSFLIDVFVQNASREPINLSVVFTVPGVVDLTGSDPFNGG